MLELIFRDDFERAASSYGLGTAPDGTVYTTPTGQDNCHRDGHAVVCSVVYSTSFYAGLPTMVTGACAFDFYTSSNPNDRYLTYQVSVGGEIQPNGQRYLLSVYAAPAGSGGTWYLSVGGQWTFPTLLASTWYRVRAEWDGTTERIRIWAVGSAEPTTWDASGPGTTYPSVAAAGIRIYGPGATGTGRWAGFDNLAIWRTFPNTPAFADDFDRTGTGLGDGWVFREGSDDPSVISSTDGSVASFASGGLWEEWTNPALFDTPSGWLRWDFHVPADISDSSPVFGVAIPTMAEYLVLSSSGPEWWVTTDTRYGYVSFYPAAGEWWTVWVDFGHSMYDRVKVWPRDHPSEEPAWTDLPSSDVHYGTWLPAEIEMNTTPAASPFEIDNFFFWTTGPVPVLGSFTLDAHVLPPQRFAVAAVLAAEGFGMLDFDAILARTFPISAWIRRVASFRLAAVAGRPRDGSFSAAAAIGDRQQVLLLDAHVVRRPRGSFRAKAWKYAPPRLGDFDADAFVVGTTGDLGVDAQISRPASPVGLVELAAVASDTYRHSTFPVRTSVLSPRDGLFELGAVVGRPTVTGSFALDGSVARSIGLGAFVVRPFSMSAVVSDPNRELTFDAYVRTSGYGFIRVGAVVASGGFAVAAVIAGARGDDFEMVALIRPGDRSFGLDAAVARAFGLSAWISPAFRMSAFIASDAGQKYFPPGSGGWDPGGGVNPPPIDPGTGGTWLPPHHQARIQIFVNDEDVTQHVLLAGCTFTQHAGNNPGTFSLPLRGVWKKYDGGEEVRVEIDGFRQFGGFVTSVDHDYSFPDVAGEDTDERPNPIPITRLSGTDFNGLFDRVYIYNVPDLGSRTSGEYKTIDPLPKGLSDAEYIRTVFGRYIDAPWRRLFDYTSHVDAVGSSPSPEVPFTVETGQTLRQFMAALSQMTNAIWYLDPYYDLHNHSRSNASAPRAITDGTGSDSGGDPTGGIHCRDLSITWSIENMTNDTFVYGTLAEDVSGKIIFSRRTDPVTIEKHGLWQYSEFRGDLHLKSHVSQRAGILQARADRVIHAAKCRIFEKGFQAGQVVSLFSGEFDVAENIPITSVTMTFAASQGFEDGKAYGIPVYDLELSNDPEPPWDLYDALPWEFHDYQYDPSFPQFRMPHIPLWNKPAGDTIGPCVEYTPMWATGGPTSATHFYGPPWYSGYWLTHYLSPLPWCVVLWLPARSRSFTVVPTQLPDDLSRYPTGDSGMVSYADDVTAQLYADAVGQVGYNAGQEARARVPLPAGDAFARVRWDDDGSLTARIWPANSPEPDTWQVTSRPQPPALVDPEYFAGGKGWALPSALSVSAHERTRVQVGGRSGWGWVWFQPYMPTYWFPHVFAYLPSATWRVSWYPAGTRPYIDPAYDYGNTLDAIAYPYDFPRPDVVIVDAGTPLGGTWRGQVLHRLLWDWAYSPSIAEGAWDDPRMVSSTYGYYGFRAPPGATRFEFSATVYLNVPETGLFGIGSENGPTGEGALPFEVWLSDYRGAADTADPAHEVIFAAISPDFNYGPGAADEGIIAMGFHPHIERPIAGGETVQLGGRITVDWGALMSSHGPGPLIYAGLKRVIELKMTDIRLRFFWDPVPGGSADPLGPCEEDMDPGIETGWGSEVVAVDEAGHFTSRLSLAATTLNVYYRGRYLAPDEWTQISDTEFRLVTPGPRCLRLVYLAQTAIISQDQSTSREHDRNVPADMLRLHDVRPL